MPKQHIPGKRKIDVYRNGLMFERDHVVGVKAGRASPDGDAQLKASKPAPQVVNNP